MEDEFYNLVNQIHNKIERGEKQFRLMDDKVAWNRFCASVYAIEDAQCAIDAYCEMPFLMIQRESTYTFMDCYKHSFYNKMQPMDCPLLCVQKE